MAKAERSEKMALMRKAMELAADNVRNNHGGPFGALVVKDGQIIGMGCNRVTSLHDPTAHAEIQAIREACKHLQQFQLTDCEIYTSCEPCPMCIGAIYWARIKAVYYAYTKEDAARIGFDDKFIYEQIALPIAQRSILMKQIERPDTLDPFKDWEMSPNRIDY